MALAIGVFIGGVVQMLWQVPALVRIGMLPKISFNLRAAFNDAGVRRVLKQMVPATLAVSVSQVSLVINTGIAASLGAGAVSWISYADRLMEFPTALLGVALGTILMPSLAHAHSSNNEAEYKNLLNWGLRLTFLLALPAAVGLGCLSEALTSSLFHYGKFTGDDVHMTARALSMYAIGLIGLISVKILASAYYAKQDIKTPVKIALLVLVMTQVMNWIFVPYLGHAGLSLSIGLGACLNASILGFLLYRRNMFIRGAWFKFFVRVFIALLVLGAFAYGVGHQIDWIGMGATEKVRRLVLLFAVIIASVVVYFSALFAMGFRLRDFKLVTLG
jgi:putative peptidoglycan lipid II flippase